MYKVKRFSQMTEIQQRQYGLLGNFKKYANKLKAKDLNRLNRKLSDAEIANEEVNDRLRRIKLPGYEEVRDPKASVSIIRNNAKKNKTRVMKSNRTYESSMAHSKEINDDFLNNQWIKNPRQVKKFKNAAKSNKHIVLLGDGFSKSTDTLAHELGHAQNSNSKNPVVRFIHNHSGSNLNPDDKGLYQMARHAIKNKMRINEEARASRNAIKMMEESKLDSKKLEQGKTNLKLALDSYKTGAKIDNLIVRRNTFHGNQLTKELDTPVNIKAIKRRD